MYSFIWYSNTTNGYDNYDDDDDYNGEDGVVLTTSRQLEQKKIIIGSYVLFYFVKFQLAVISTSSSLLQTGQIYERTLN